jgi:hypothetical protein
VLNVVLRLVPAFLIPGLQRIDYFYYGSRGTHRYTSTPFFHAALPLETKECCEIADRSFSSF